MTVSQKLKGGINYELFLKLEKYLSFQSSLYVIV
jgi:hypothetical protein